MCPRSQIFRRDAEKVLDIDSMKKVMRYNDYLSDPLSKGNPANTICSRYDLEKKGPKNTGCYDTKITNYAMFKQFKALAVNGPTTGTGHLPVFQWSKSPSIDPYDKQSPHLGLPDRYNFNFVEMSAEWNEFPDWSINQNEICMGQPQTRWDQFNTLYLLFDEFPDLLSLHFDVFGL